MGMATICSMVIPVVLSGMAEVLAYNVQILHRIDIGDLYGDKSTPDSENDHPIRPSISIYYPEEPSVDPEVNNDDASLDTWSVVWYIASFGGLIVFFLIVSCSEWCCRRNARRNFSRTTNVQTVSPIVPDTPPPSYDQFAPPDYESICYKMPGTSKNEKSEFDIYVVPVHSFGTIMEDARRGEGVAYGPDDSPPSYQSAFNNLPVNVPVIQIPPNRKSRNSSNVLDPRNLPSLQSSTSVPNVQTISQTVMPNNTQSSASDSMPQVTSISPALLPNIHPVSKAVSSTVHWSMTRSGHGNRSSVQENSAT